MQPREEDILKVSEEVANECKAIQDEIKNLLNEVHVNNILYIIKVYYHKP